MVKIKVLDKNWKEFSRVWEGAKEGYEDDEVIFAGEIRAYPSVSRAIKSAKKFSNFRVVSVPLRDYKALVGFFESEAQDGLCEFLDRVRQQGALSKVKRSIPSLGIWNPKGELG